MQKWDLTQLTPKQTSALNGFIKNLIIQALDKKNLDHVWQKVELALDQTYQDSIYVDQVTTDIDLESTVHDGLESDLNNTDEFSDLYTPQSYRLHKGWTTNLKASSIPNTEDWFGIERTYSSFFDRLGLNDFLPVVNEMWERNIYVENDRFSRKKKLAKAIAQFCAFGGTPAIIYYNAIHDYVDLKVPHIRDHGVYPVTDDWRTTNNVIRYPVNYMELKGRSDLVKEYVDIIRPNMNFNEEDGSATQTSTSRSQQYEHKDSPFGAVILHDIWIPSLFIEEDNDSPAVEASGILLTIAYNQKLKNNITLTDYTSGENLFILKASKDVSATEYQILFASFDEVLPNQLHGKGPIIPFLIFQKIQNQLISGMARDVARGTDPPIQVSSAENDLEDTPIPEFEHGAMYEGLEVKALDVPGLDQRLTAFLAWDKYLGEMVEEASGMGKLNMGGRPSTGRTKFEVQEQLDGGGLRINDANELFADDILRPFLVGCLTQTQYQLKTQTEDGIDFVMDLAKKNQMSFGMNQDEAYKVVLEENKLFQRLLNFTSIEPKYKEFYRQHQTRMNENEQYISEFQSVLTQLNSAQNQLAAPIQPFQEPTDPEQFDASSIDMARQEYYQVQEDKKKELTQAVSDLQARAKAAQLLIEDIKPIPAPDLRLYYELLAHEIDDSDIVVYGSKSTLNKSIKRRAILELMEVLKGLPVPEIVQEYDFKDMIRQYVNSIGLSSTSVRKRTEEINRTKQQQKQQQAQMQAQLQMQQQQNGQ